MPDIVMSSKSSYRQVMDLDRLHFGEARLSTNPALGIGTTFTAASFNAIQIKSLVKQDFIRQQIVHSELAF